MSFGVSPEIPAGLREREKNQICRTSQSPPIYPFTSGGHQLQSFPWHTEVFFFLDEVMLRLSCPQSASHKGISAGCALEEPWEHRNFRKVSTAAHNAAVAQQKPEMKPQHTKALEVMLGSLDLLKATRTKTTFLNRRQT